MVECTGLENRRACKRTVGSNPTLSAILQRFAAHQSEARQNFDTPLLFNKLARIFYA